MRPTHRSTSPSPGSVLVATLAAVGVLLLLFPASGVDSDPPVCRAILPYVVPCQGWVAPLLAAATAVLVAFVLWRVIDRHTGDV